jgi:hypothetical protein
MAFNQNFGSQPSAFLKTYLQKPEFDDSKTSQFEYSPAENFSIADTTPKNRYYSASETIQMLNGKAPLTPIQRMRGGIDDAVVNTGNAFGQDWSGYTGLGHLARPDYKGKRPVEWGLTQSGSR